MSLSRNSYYAALFVGLLMWLVAMIYLARSLILSTDMAAKFVPMVTGLIVTLLFFNIFKGQIEKFEKKRDLEELLNAIESRIFSIFQELVSLCAVESVLIGDENTEKAWKDLWKRQLNSLIREVRLAMLDELWRNGELRSSYSLLLSNERNVISEEWRRYARYLSHDQRVSFIRLESHLDELSVRVVAKGEDKTTYGRDISVLIKKAMTEINKLRNSGIDVFSERRGKPQEPSISQSLARALKRVLKAVHLSENIHLD